MSERVIDRSESQVPEETGAGASELARRAPNGSMSLARSAPADFMALLNNAIEKQIPADHLERMLVVYERMADRSAAQEFAEALAQFQDECPPIRKSKKADIATRAGGSYSYHYAPLDAIEKVVRPILHRLGLGYNWSGSEEGGKITAVCTLRHVNGHKEVGSFTCASDSAAAMSGAQKSAAAYTFARRQSLVSVLGIRQCDIDTDGADPGADTGVKVTEHQAANLQALIDETKTDRARFLKWVGADSLANVPASKFADAVRFLERKRGAQS